ncbi:hypothetical protein QLX08_001046 [Tetragonisca angustula]|uniref:Uncharacterized protein n=1 Tax=Tetragonisca angustula TaxID=166442 RepID=A0AAW1AJV1_9HYME
MQRRKRKTERDGARKGEREWLLPEKLEEKHLKTKAQSRFPFGTKQQLAGRQGQGSSSLFDSQFSRRACLPCPPSSSLFVYSRDSDYDTASSKYDERQRLNEPLLGVVCVVNASPNFTTVLSLACSYI